MLHGSNQLYPTFKDEAEHLFTGYLTHSPILRWLTKRSASCSPRTNFSNVLSNTIYESEAASPVILGSTTFSYEIGAGRVPTFSHWRSASPN